MDDHPHGDPQLPAERKLPTAGSSRRAVFLDRDGVLVRDTAPVSSVAKIEVLPGVPTALARLRKAGFQLIVVTNQAIVARGTVTEPELRAIQAEVERRIVNAGAPRFDAFYYCPHHPHADLAAYRVDCECRKPRPGLLRKAASDLGIDLSASLMIGDRITDIEAGHRAGCRTIWVHTGAHAEARIQSPEPPQPGLQPDHTCASLQEAVDWILKSEA